MNTEKNTHSFVEKLAHTIKNLGIVFGGIFSFVVLVGLLVFGKTGPEMIDLLRKLVVDYKLDVFIKQNYTWGLLVLVLSFFIFKVKRNNKVPENESILQSKTTREDVLTRYLTHILAKSNCLPFGDLSTLSSEPDSDTNQTEIVLNDVWTPLNVSVEPNEKGTDVENKEEEYIFEEYVEARREESSNNQSARLLLLGDPGCGKSTCFAHLAINYIGDLNTEFPKTIPILFRIDQINLESKKPLYTILSACDFDQDVNLDKLENELTDFTKNGDVVFLVDGLDELVDADQSKAVHFLELLSTEYPLCAVLASCRIEEFLSSSDFSSINDFDVCTLQPYKLTDIESYIERWYLALSKRHSYSKKNCQELSANLQEALRNDDVLLSLASTPLLTTLIALLHVNRGELPRTRSLLYSESIKLLLSDTPVWRSAESPTRPATTQAISVASDIAYYVHLKTQEANDGIRYGITSIEISQIVDRRILDKKKPTQLNVIAAREQANLLFKLMLNSNNLIVKAGKDRYEFSHRAFQEFLVSQYFASGSKSPEIIDKASDLHWAEPFRLLANYSTIDGGNLFYVLHLCREIFDSRDDVLRHCLVAEMLCEVGSVFLHTTDWSEIVEGESSSENKLSGLWREVKNSIYNKAINAPSDTAHKLRYRLFSVLSDLGDPRLVNSNGDKLPVSNHAIHMPERIITIGHIPKSVYLLNRVNTSNALPSYPLKAITVKEFSISKYLVTNYDFNKFIESGGYEQEKFWPSEESRLWLNGDNNYHKKLIEGWLNTAERDYASELSDSNMSIERLTETANKFLKSRHRPYFWSNHRFRMLNAPVVGINLWEAAAYCNWLTEKAINNGAINSDSRISVPTEFEWERAARDTIPDSDYPWGNQWNAGCGHVSHGALDLSHPVPVGMFPLGASKDGVQDLCGNVWEWTTSQAFPKEGSDDWEHCFSETFEDVVVRGSSWYNSFELARSGIRQKDRMYNIYFDVGFRWIIKRNGECK